MTARVALVQGGAAGSRIARIGRALAWVALYAGVGIGIGLLLVRLSPVPDNSRWALAANSLGFALSFGFATWLVGIRFTKHSWDALGWHTSGGLVHRITNGIGLGALMAALAVGLSFVGSRARVHLTSDWSRYVAIAGPLAAALLAAALFEELAFRGFPLRQFADAVGSWTAMGLLAVAFGVLHLTNPGATFFSTVNTALAAAWLSFAFFSPGGMGFAWGLHFGWNAGLSLLFDAPVSGYTFQVPVVQYEPGRLAWVDGGAYGPEGGVVATIVLVAGTLAVIGTRFRRPREWLAG